MGTDLTDVDLAKQRDTRDRLERDDYNNAIAGRETGRMMRFGAKSQTEREADARKAERLFRDALEQMLDDPVYRAKYELLGERLSEAERTADQMLSDIQATLRVLEREIAEMEDRAAKGPDGQPVFKTADGRVVNARGEELAPEIAAGIQWPPNATSAEEYFSAMERYDDLSEGFEEWNSYRTDILGGVRHRHEDRDNPQSIEGLENDLNLISEGSPPVPASLNSMTQSVDIPTQSATLIPTLPNS